MTAILETKNLSIQFGGVVGASDISVTVSKGEVIGVIPQSLLEKEIAHEGLTELKVVGSMHERKALMAELSDGFIAMPGGLGTLEELFETMTWAQLGFHHKPCGLLNINGYYHNLVPMLHHAAEEQFVRPKHRNLLIIDTSPDRLIQRMAEFEKANGA